MLRLVVAAALLYAASAVPQTCTGCGTNQYCAQGTCMACPIGTLMLQNQQGKDISFCKAAPQGQASICLPTVSTATGATTYSGCDPFNGVPCSSCTNGQAAPLNVWATAYSKYATMPSDNKCGGAAKFYKDAVWGTIIQVNGPEFYQPNAGASECIRCEAGKKAIGIDAATVTLNNNKCGTSKGYKSDGQTPCKSDDSPAPTDGECWCDERASLAQSSTTSTAGATKCSNEATGISPANTCGVAKKTCIVDGISTNCGGDCQDTSGADAGKCKPGWAKDGDNCVKCGIGKYTDEASDCSGTPKRDCTKCTACPAGTTNTAAGQSLTEAQKTANTGATPAAPAWLNVCKYTNCQKGSYCPGGGPSKTCPIGTYAGAVAFVKGATTDRNVDGTGTTGGLYERPDGYTGFSSCSKCGSGSNTGSQQCGSISPAGATCFHGWVPSGEDGSCTMCMNGTFAHAGDTECTQCPSGYFSGYAPQTRATTAMGSSRGQWYEDLASNAATTCSDCGTGSFRVFNDSNSNCTYCPAGSTLVRWSEGHTFDYKSQVMGLNSKAFGPGPECRPCARGTFSNATTVQYAACSQGDGQLHKTVKDQNDASPLVNYMANRGKCQLVNNWYVDGGACYKCPIGMVSNGVGQTECTACPDGLLPSWDKGSCVNGVGMMDFFWVIMAFSVLVAIVLFAPCCKARLGGLHAVELGFLGGYRLKTGFICLFVFFIVAIIILFAGKFNSYMMYADWVFYMLFFLLCVPGCCAAMYPAPGDADDLEKQNNPVAS